MIAKLLTWFVELLYRPTLLDRYKAKIINEYLEEIRKQQKINFEIMRFIETEEL